MDKRQLSMDEIQRALKEHQRWLDTNHQSGAQADFSNCDFRSFDFCHEKRGELHEFRSMNFRGADFSGVSFERLHFKDCDFTDAVLDNVCATDVHFEHNDFLKAKLVNARLSKCDIEKNDFQNAFWGYARIGACTFSYNDFHSAYLNSMSVVQSCQFLNNHFYATNPSCADFSSTEFIGNTFTNSDFYECTFDNSSFEKCNFKQSGFLNCFVEKCQFKQCELEQEFIHSTFTPRNAPAIHFACDLSSQTICGKNLFNGRSFMKVDDFIKKLSDMPATTKEDKVHKKMLLSLGKMLKEACAEYHRRDDYVR